MNGRSKQVTLVLHRLIGAVVAYANQWKGWKRFTSAVEKAMEQFGTQAFEILLGSLLSLTNLIDYWSVRCLFPSSGCTSFCARARAPVMTLHQYKRLSEIQSRNLNSNCQDSVKSSLQWLVSIEFVFFFFLSNKKSTKNNEHTKKKSLLKLVT